MIYGFVETAESIIEQFLWIPFYYEFKCIFLLWLVLPQTKGAAYLFQHFVCPFMQCYASQIDPIFAKADQARCCASWHACPSPDCLKRTHFHQAVMRAHYLHA